MYQYDCSQHVNSTEIRQAQSRIQDLIWEFFKNKFSNMGKHLTDN